jgi:cytoskeletal protein CcmA (bactofilin family)
MSFTAFGRGIGEHTSNTSLLSIPNLPSVPNGNQDGSGNGNGSTNEHGNGNSNGQLRAVPDLTRAHGISNGQAKLAAQTVCSKNERVPFFRATLSSGVSIKGTVKFRSELLIDGDFEGTIESLGRLTVGRNGHVRGDIQTRSAAIHGTVEGNLSVGEKCELRSGCTLRGDIETARLVVDEDVNFTGSAAIATRDYLAEMRMPVRQPTDAENASGSVLGMASSGG